MKYPLRPRVDENRLARRREFHLRRATAPLRGLPAFLIAGTMKGGTSSLFSYIAQHPMVAKPVRKECHYFSLGHRKGKSLGWYRAHFPRRSVLCGGKITGEATPSYLFEPGAAERIASVLPDARLVVLLRNPVERAISHYYHEVRMGREYLPIETAMEVEDERLAAAAATEDERLETYSHASYKKQGLYLEQIERLAGIFPPGQILILGSGTLFRTPDRALDETFRFLGLPDIAKSYDFAVKNRGWNRAKAPDRLYEDLERFFAPHNERLFDYLGRRLDW